MLCENESTLLDLGQQLVKRGVHLPEVVALHNGDDSELVLLADPDHLGLVLADPNASPVRPVGGHSRGSEVVVSCHVVEEEVMISELVGLGFVDEVLVTRSETVVLAGNAERLEHFHHAVLELDSFLFAH